MKYFFAFFFFFLPIFLLMAESKRRPEGLEVKEMLGKNLSKESVLINERGEKVFLNTFFQDSKPIVFIPSYYSCIRLCSFIFQGVQRVADKVALSGMKLGKDYKIISLSFNPKDTYQLASKKGKEIRSRFINVNVKEKNWEFLTGNEKVVRSLLNSIGYYYRWDGDDKKDISHSAVIMMLSPKGKVVRYLYGIQFIEKDFRLALVEASKGKIGSAFEKVLLYCFRFDALKGKYVPYVWAFVRIGGVVTMLFLLFIWFYFRKITLGNK